MQLKFTNCFQRKAHNCLIFLYLFISIITAYSCQKNISINSFDDKVNESYDDLISIVNEKKQHLDDYMNQTKGLASSITNDEAMLSFFKVKKEYYDLSKDTIMPKEIVDQIEDLKQQVQDHYLKHYIQFYDILFIDTKGDIFYTIRKEADYHMNIFEGRLSNTTLSKKLKDMPSESFIDFQFYEISGEPSAFFIEPIFEKRKNIGWLVLQCSINKINNMLVSDNELGSTGEVVLVNRDHFMLTNSRFKVEPTILKQQLPAQNIESKFKEKKGLKAVIDYRGKEVHSAFDVFNVLGSEWLIIAKTDKNEIVNKYYLENKDILYPQIEKYLLKQVKYSKNRLSLNNEKVSVHMDEFHRGDTTKALFTQGVSTCTAVNFSYPGQFAYLAHISPYDAIYGELKTDIVNQVFKQISYFEITESKKNSLEFQIMTTQTRSLKELINTIIANGYFLSQIKIAYHSNASYGNMYCDIANKSTTINWYMPDESNSTVSQNYKNIEDLETIILKVAAQ